MFLIYGQLSTVYGQQGWWPVTPKGEITPKYGISEHNKLQRFEICIGAILTQNTAWTNAEKALVELNKSKLLEPEKILNTPKDKLASLIKSAGYFNQKAERLHTMSKFFERIDLEKEELSVLREKLLALNGVGPETADSILLYAAEQPVFVIDAYTKRMFSRVGYLEESASYEEWQKLFHKELPRSTQLYNEYHALIVEHAKRNCMKKPVCNGCVLDGVCKRRINHTKDYI